jgi:TPP-dependent pyruvate/acetoin dehydrogenase alpha subunit
MNFDLEVLERLLIEKGIITAKELAEIKEEIIKEEQQKRDKYDPYL